MAAGPWFTVTQEGQGFVVMDRIFISNGEESTRATVEYRARLAPPEPLVVVAGRNP